MCNSDNFANFVVGIVLARNLCASVIEYRVLSEGMQLVSTFSTLLTQYTPFWLILVASVLVSSRADEYGQGGCGG